MPTFAFDWWLLKQNLQKKGFIYCVLLYVHSDLHIQAS